MSERPDDAPGGSPEANESAIAHGAPSLAEDLLLLLFQPEHGDTQDDGHIAGENILYYVLGGAVLADLGIGEHVRTARGWGGTVTVEAIEERPPADHILRSAWEYIAEKPRGVQAVLAAVGPTLRGPLLDRLVERGDIRRTTKKAFGLFDTTVLHDGGSGRRRALLADVHAVLVDGAPASPRVAAVAALIHGSGTLPQFDPDIPWTSAVITRAEQLKQGNWGAGATAEAVARTVTATIVNNVIIAAAAVPRS